MATIQERIKTLLEDVEAAGVKARANHEAAAALHAQDVAKIEDSGDEARVAAATAQAAVSHQDMVEAAGIVHSATVAASLLTDASRHAERLG